MATIYSFAPSVASPFPPPPPPPPPAPAPPPPPALSHSSPFLAHVRSRDTRPRTLSRPALYIWQANSLIQTFRIGMRPDRGSTPPLHAVKKRGGGREDPPHKRDNGKRDTLPKIRPSSSFGSDRIEGSPTAERTAAQLTPRGRKRRMLLYVGLKEDSSKTNDRKADELMARCPIGV